MGSKKKNIRRVVYLSDTCVRWPDTSCSHTTPTGRTVPRSGRETHMALLRENKTKHTITLLLVRLET